LSNIKPKKPFISPATNQRYLKPALLFINTPAKNRKLFFHCRHYEKFFFPQNN
jgi:hypothetical protein